MLNKRSFIIGINIALIFLWGSIALFHLVYNRYNQVSSSFLLLYICYVMSKCTEIRYINEVDEYDD